MIKNDIWLQENKPVEPFDPELVNPTSIDVRWSGKVRIPSLTMSALDEYLVVDDRINNRVVTKIVNTWDRDQIEDLWEPVVEVDELVLRPYLHTGDIYLMDTLEQVIVPPDMTCNFQLKSSIGRLFIEHLHAGWGDAGFGLKNPSTYTLEIVNLSPWGLRIKKGQRIGQLIFQNCNEPTKLYNGKYQGQKEPKP